MDAARVKAMKDKMANAKDGGAAVTQVMAWGLRGEVFVYGVGERGRGVGRESWGWFGAKERG